METYAFRVGIFGLFSKSHDGVVQNKVRNGSEGTEEMEFEFF